MRAAWGQRARGSGTVFREGVLGLPAAVREILNIEALEEPMLGSYRQARGVIPCHPGTSGQKRSFGGCAVADQQNVYWDAKVFLP